MSPSHKQSHPDLLRNLSQGSKVTLESPQALATIKITDEGERTMQVIESHVSLETPNLGTPGALETTKSLESLIQSAASVYDNEEKRQLKIDLSSVSFLKPHIIDPKTYALAHQGHTREAVLKPDNIKSIE